MEETMLLTNALGDSPSIRVLNFLIEGKGLDYSLTDISENAHVSWTTLHRIWNDLMNSQMVRPTREIGRAKLFTINQENPAVRELIKMHDVLLVQHTEQHLSMKVKVMI